MSPAEHALWKKRFLDARAVVEQYRSQRNQPEHGRPIMPLEHQDACTEMVRAALVLAEQACKDPS